MIMKPVLIVVTKSSWPVVHKAVQITQTNSVLPKRLLRGDGHFDGVSTAHGCYYFTNK